MLIDKYLPLYHFQEYHSISVKGDTELINYVLRNCNFSESKVISTLFWLRGIPRQFRTINNISNAGFVKLEENEEEMVFGITTTSPYFRSCNIHTTHADFEEMATADKIKAVINFKVHSESNTDRVISTETRIWCGNEQLKKKFRRYWFVVKPFSGIIRQQMLKQIAAEVKLQMAIKEKASKQS